MNKMGEDPRYSPTNPPQDSNIDIGQESNEGRPKHIEDETVESSR